MRYYPVNCSHKIFLRHLIKLIENKNKVRKVSFKCRFEFLESLALEQTSIYGIKLSVMIKIVHARYVEKTI